MMSKDEIYHRLLTAVRTAYSAHPALPAFTPLPDDLPRQPLEPEHRPCSTALQKETGLHSSGFTELQEQIIASAPFMKWRQIYYDDQPHIFMDRLGCYSIIGEGGPFASTEMRLFVIYMPPNLYYPWHIHPAEELYMVVSGSAVFKREYYPDEILSEGQSMFHESNQPHAIETSDTPMLSLVAWRNHLHTPPVLVDID